ncbi:MAG: precorrin-2 C(20)-methyltransferase [Lachnospiraceae bacterium]|nr:precorrin-2 C(20)-methyltransferase [Lachnospiraceae bacterium]
MAGKLFGIGVGPGDPELLTVKALKCIRTCDVLAVPGTQKEETAAYKIVIQAAPEIAEKSCLELEMPMTKDKKKLAESHRKAFGRIQEVLDQGKQIGFLTLGDPCIYSTYIYMHKLAAKAGYETEIINGIPSFCAVSAKLNQGLVEQSQMLHILPSTYGVEAGMDLPGTKILMKPGKKLKSIKEKLAEYPDSQASMIERCGMEEERIYRTAKEIPEQTGYYSLLIVKEQEI